VLLDVAAAARGLCDQRARGVGGSQLAAVQRATAALQQLEAVYEKQLGELREALRQQEHVGALLQVCVVCVGEVG